MIICSECGCPINEKDTICPECGNPVITKFTNQTGHTNCPNCGAPVTNNVACEYCDSAFLNVVQAPEKIIINNNNTIREESSGLGTGAAAFLGGIIGGILSD